MILSVQCLQIPPSSLFSSPSENINIDTVIINANVVANATIANAVSTIKGPPICKLTNLQPLEDIMCPNNIIFSMIEWA